MKFYYTRLQVVCDPEFSEILMAEIAEAGFDTFMEIEKGFEAYGEEKKIDTGLVESIRKKYKHVNPLLLLFDKVEKDRKSTRLNSSHSQISYAVFCLKKKKKK